MINSLTEKFNTLSIRERVICLSTLLVVIWGAWDNFVYQPISAEKKRLDIELSTLEIELSANQQAGIQIEALGRIDPNTTNRELLKQARKDLIKLKQQLNIGDKKFVPAYLMTTVLQDILQKNHGLKLLQLETLPVTTLLDKEPINSGIYRHGLSITLSGNYFNTLKYLKSLESLPWRFNWGSIEYKVIEYPAAITTIHIYTLSFEENWLGL